MSSIIPMNGACVLFDNEVIWWRGLMFRKHLENRMSAQPTVQTSRTMTTKNGVSVTLQFSPKPNPQIRRDIARMLLVAFEKGSVS